MWKRRKYVQSIHIWIGLTAVLDLLNICRVSVDYPVALQLHMGSGTYS
jgi:hypothetical protein